MPARVPAFEVPGFEGISFALYDSYYERRDTESELITALNGFDVREFGQNNCLYNAVTKWPSEGAPEINSLANLHKDVLVKRLGASLALPVEHEHYVQTVVLSKMTDGVWHAERSKRPFITIPSRLYVLRHAETTASVGIEAYKLALLIMRNRRFPALPRGLGSSDSDRSRLDSRISWMDGRIRDEVKQHIFRAGRTNRLVPEEAPKVVKASAELYNLLVSETITHTRGVHRAELDLANMMVTSYRKVTTHSASGSVGLNPWLCASSIQAKPSLTAALRPAASMTSLPSRCTVASSAAIVGLSSPPFRSSASSDGVGAVLGMEGLGIEGLGMEGLGAEDLSAACSHGRRGAGSPGGRSAHANRRRGRRRRAGRRVRVVRVEGW